MSLAMRCKSSSSFDQKVKYFITLISYLNKEIAKLIFRNIERKANQCCYDLFEVKNFMPKENFS